MNPEDWQQLCATVYGRVQGVSFRYYTTLVARELNLCGWVRNQQDGSVQVLAEGTRQDLGHLLEFLHRGSPAAYVERVEVEWKTATYQYEQFHTTYTR